MKQVHCLALVKYMQQAEGTNFTTTSKDILNGLPNTETEKKGGKNSFPFRVW